MHEVGFLGLGRMGGNMVARSLESGSVRVVVWNRSPEKVKKAVRLGATGASTPKDLVKKLKAKRKVVWLMLPSGDVTEKYFQLMLNTLKKGDVLIDGGNSNFHDTIRRHAEAKKKGIGMLDVGVSGGIVAANTGYPMMVGGSKEVWDHCKAIFWSFGMPDGYDLVGSGGAGHYVKMVHNAIEYGMMQSIGEGFDLLVKQDRFPVNLKKTAKIWNHGCIIDSFLMKMAAQALDKDPKLKYLKPYIDDSGEGKWSAQEALEHEVPFIANTYALHARYISRDNDSYAFKMVSALRNEFGGHKIKK
tara:strand:- start:113 stop:1018 length:906 start_codon:yes stop_codon:yes gene_type:complete